MYLYSVKHMAKYSVSVGTAWTERKGGVKDKYKPWSDALSIISLWFKQQGECSNR